MTSWLITGGSGSFGKAFTRRLLADPATSKVVIFSRDELKQAEMAAEIRDERLRFVIGNVTDQERCERAMRGIDHVVHAAAMKRVETCEANPHEAVQTNVIGSSVVGLAAIRAGVKRAVILSTDKAVAPNTLYGMTKACAERLWVNYNVYAAGQVTRLSASRYGNVLGSRGSVLNVWQKQAAAGEPLTMTDPLMTRFWMTMDDACELVFTAFREMAGGEVFIPKLHGISMAGFAETFFPAHPWTTTGLRPGEKMHEALVGEDEVRSLRDSGDYYTLEPHRTWEDIMPARGTAVPPGFTYRSDSTRMDVDALRRLVA